MGVHAGLHLQGAALDDFSSRQLVALVACLARLDAAAALPEGRVEAWINEIKAAHAKQSLLAGDAAELERALDRQLHPRLPPPSPAVPSRGIRIQRETRPRFARPRRRRVLPPAFPQPRHR